MKKWSTSTNISQLISRGLELKQRRKNCKHETAALIFFDFNKIYDSVPRDILIRKLMEFNIPWNIVKLIKNMLKDFTLHYNNEIIIPKRGLVQGSVLSPLIFNLFINDLLNEFEANKITALGYADNIVCICENNEQIQLSCELMKRWSKMNRMTINPRKSGILRILARRGKWLSIENWLKIPEVNSYWYLGVRITQSLMLEEHEEKLIQTEQNLRRKIWILRPSLVSTKSRFIIYRTIIRSKFLYAAITICTYNHRYTLKLETMLYRILKNFFYICTNIKKEKVFKVLGIWNIEETIRRANLRKCGLQIRRTATV